nr:MAG: glyoxalase/bleomycin resistance/extradiol dioxygenase family protein [Acidobacteriota bacterium]
MFQGLRTVIYRVPDLDRAKAWYADVFGVQPYFDQPFYVGFDVGGYELGLQPAADAVVGDSVQAYWGVPDIAAAHAAILQKGAQPKSPIRDVGDGIKVALVTDPWGNEIGLIENPHFKAR